MRMARGRREGLAEVVAAVRESGEGATHIHRPIFEAQLRLLGGGQAVDHHLVVDRGGIAAVFFPYQSRRSVTAVLLDHHEETVAEVLRVYFNRQRRWVETVIRPSWDLRVGQGLLPLFEAAGFRSGPPERLHRLDRTDYQAGFRVREGLEGSRVDYRMHERDIASTLPTLTPLLEAWSGFFGFEGHSDETCRLFTASVDGQKVAMLWVLLAARCRPDQNDCFRQWKEIVGERGIFIRSAITEEPFCDRGIGASLHRFMLSRFFRGPSTADSAWLIASEGNTARTSLAASLGYRPGPVSRYHFFTR